ncbi:pyroglutamyl-peptidase I [Amycolatopsis antarctica]|uniref:Pyrrolidone-carboxylate peptidase n=1 Tax=Amycolatopsis antarctica TaxID=1854586 RepID=A0A263D037_9PSEU|nr:pyroglutamyl-peptidase I [Amycolatopsis antarctica]OZM70906.1 pyroglutamyl-peptidase I [Amycolatopsis antarctica]
MTRVLLTGFEPFGGEPVNPSWQAVSTLVGGAGGGGYEPVAVELPCVFDRSLPALREAIAAHRPDVVVCVGQAGGRAGLSVERVAVNLVDARIPDNAGAQPLDVPVAENGPAAYFATLPVKACAEAARAAGVPASVSHTAGTYVCNQVFYGLMHLLATDLATEMPGVRGGFVHVPYSPEQVAAAGSAVPSLAIGDCAAGLDALVRIAVEVRTDISVPGGSLH